MGIVNVPFAIKDSPRGGLDFLTLDSKWEDTLDPHFSSSFTQFNNFNAHGDGSLMGCFEITSYQFLLV